ncbi:MAG: transketolase [Clostridia bacterium]|nr:transketolase [Clostridia bacterium]
MNNIQQLTVNAIRALSSEGIDKANSGHPGLPLGCATIGYTLYSEILKHNPKHPDFFNRDRFVLSAGHGSMLLYTLLHVFGYDVSMDDLKSFRQAGSKTPGHPEYGVTPGVEVSTGPLGQGIANAVGLAVAESVMAAKYNKEGYNVVDHYTYALCGDGCMQEGIEYEAASIAGTWKLGKLIVIYDKNNITIEGSTDIAFTEDVGARHEAQGWQVLKVADGEDVDALINAVNEAKAEKDKPSLIIVRTQIGKGSKKEGSADCHGSPLGSALTEEMKKDMGYNYPPFTVPEEVKAHVASLQSKYDAYYEDWRALMKEYSKNFPEDAIQLNKDVANDYSNIDIFDGLWENAPKAEATRNSSGAVLNKVAKIVTNLIGGAADLAPSTKTYMKDLGDYFAGSRTGRNMHFGIREHAMSAICNGIQLHGGLNAFCSTFFVFSDYMKNAMRMSAIMSLPVTYVLTHDSIGVGEDGPTHEPVEQLAGLRAMPNLNVFRPADRRETVAAYVTAITSGKPTCIVCSRQDLVQLDKSGKEALKGGYVVYGEGTPDIILIGAGSEVGLCMESAKVLESEGVKVRVVSMPCIEVFEKQSEEYKNSVLPKSVTRRVAVEAGVTMPWYKFVGLDGKVIGLDSFGESGKPEVLMQKFGFTVDNVVKAAKEIL